MLELCPCEGGATKGYMDAGWEVYAVDLDSAALKRNPAAYVHQGDALDVLARLLRGERVLFERTFEGNTFERWMALEDFDAIHASFPCQRWSANGANPAKDEWPDLVTPGRELLNASGKPWVMENVPHAPLRRDLVLCGTMFGLTAQDTDGVTLYLQRHRVFESNVPLAAPGSCLHLKGVQWAGVYGGARKDKIEARTVRRGGYVPPDADVQSALLGGVPWMTGKGRRECIPPAYAAWIGRQLLAHVRGEVAA